MLSKAELLRNHALQIWHAGLQAVRADRLVKEHLRVETGLLKIADEEIPLKDIRRILVVGAGKAAAAMTTAVEEALGPWVLREKQVTGWVNVPANCVRPTKAVHLHAARPPGANEPTEAAAQGAEKILQLVASASADDLVICVLSGGGSALLPAPVPGISLQDKLTVTRFLSAAGASIEELNTVRKQLSRIKGGGLARACRAGWLVSLIISDVLGDKLEIIASGPTVPDTSTPQDALRILNRYDPQRRSVPAAIYTFLESAQRERTKKPTCRVLNVIIGNNATAVDAAGRRADQLGYHAAMISATSSEGQAEEVGRHLAQMALHMRKSTGPNCLISGGEPVVKLVEESRRGKGGRNQQLALAFLQAVLREDYNGLVLVAGGTDGEDGPTEAAGAIVDAQVINKARALGLDPADFLARNDAYNFFRPLDALLVTGPTDTNVCDVRVLLVEKQAK